MLLPFKPLIKMLIKLHGFIPGDVFSICAQLYDLDIQKHEATGCARLDTTLMWCVAVWRLLPLPSLPFFHRV